MNIPERIIVKAIEGGWNYGRGYVVAEQIERPDGFDEKAIMSLHKIALDQTFWVALGTALGWTEYQTTRDVIGTDWRDYAHRFYALILTGGDTEAFWEEIYPSNI